MSESKLDEIGFASGLGELSISSNKMIDDSSLDGTIGSRKVYLYESGKNRIYFFTDNKKIDALVYLFDNRVMAMKNLSENKGLIYNLFQYIINIKEQKIRLTPKDKLTSEGIKWITDQISRPNGFKITDAKGNKIDPKALYSEWENARKSGSNGSTEIVISESKNSKQIRENEIRLMPMDIFGATLKKIDKQYEERINMNNILKQGISEGYTLKKTKVEKTFTPGDPDEYYTSGGADVTTKDTDYEIINNKTGQVVGTASWTTNDYMGPGALKITMKNGATRWLDIWDSEKGNPQSAFNRFVKDPRTAKKYKDEDVTEADMPTDQGDVGAGLGAGRSPTTLESKSNILKGISVLLESETHTYTDDMGNKWRVDDEGNKTLVKRASGFGTLFTNHYTKPRGMYFYNVKPGQESDAIKAGLKQSKKGKWYSISDNATAGKLFGPGRYWEPKN
jgi:hypothetical protein